MPYNLTPEAMMDMVYRGSTGPVAPTPLGASQSNWDPAAFEPAPVSTENALSLIRSFEGYRDTPYWDVNAYRTGYGSDTITRADGSVVRVRQGMRTTRDEAERDLERRVNSEFVPIAMRAVGEDVWSRLNENQRAALTSIAYNYGRIPDSVASAVKTPGMEDDVLAIRGLGSHNDGINRDRRNKEAAIYAGSGYGAMPGSGAGGVVPPRPGMSGGNPYIAQKPMVPGSPGNVLQGFQTSQIDPKMFMRQRNALAPTPLGGGMPRNALGRL